MFSAYNFFYKIVNIPRETILTKTCVCVRVYTHTHTHTQSLSTKRLSVFNDCVMQGVFRIK